MSTNRHAAMKYAQEVKERSLKRPQPNVFTKPAPKPPSTAFQDSERGSVEDKSDETRSLRNEEKLIENDNEKDIVDKTSFTQAKPTGIVMASKMTTTTKSVADQGPKDAFSKCWTTVSEIFIPQVTFDKYSSFVPMSFSLCEVIFAMEEILNRNEELKWINPFFFSLPVRVYHAVTFHVQVLRAKEVAGTLTKSEGSWLRAFFRRFKDTSLPISGPLIPIYSNIVSCLPDDKQFEYVHPTIPTEGTYTSAPAKDKEKSAVIVRPTHFVIPSITMIGDMLHQFCRKPRITDNDFDDDGNYVPFRLESGGTLGGVRFPPIAAGQTLDTSLSQLLLNPILSRPLPESQSRLKEIHQHYKRSRITGFPSPNPDEGFNPLSPSDSTMLGEQMDWFQPCIDMAATQAKFFAHSQNLSSIPVIGGLSAVTQVKLDFGEQRNTLPTTIDKWYPNSYCEVTARFRATTANLEIDQQFQAAYALTNGKIPWKDANDKPIGTRESGLRHGPFWDNRKFNFQLDHDARVLSTLHSMLQTQFYDAHGKANT